MFVLFLSHFCPFITYLHAFGKGATPELAAELAVDLEEDLLDDGAEALLVHQGLGHHHLVGEGSLDVAEFLQRRVPVGSLRSGEDRQSLEEYKRSKLQSNYFHTR